MDVFIAFLRTRDKWALRWGWCVWGGAGSPLKLSFLNPNPLCQAPVRLEAPLFFSALCKTAQQHLQKPGELLGGCQGMAPSQGKLSGQILAAWGAPLESSSASLGLCWGHS